MLAVLGFLLRKFLQVLEEKISLFSFIKLLSFDPMTLIVSFLSSTAWGGFFCFLDADKFCRFLVVIFRLDRLRMSASESLLWKAEVHEFLFINNVILLRLTEIMQRRKFNNFFIQTRNDSKFGFHDEWEIIYAKNDDIWI